MATVVATLAKEVSGTLTFIMPKTTADIVEYDPGDNSGNVSVQAKLRAISADLTNGISTLTNGMSNYYNKTQVDDLVYTPIQLVSASVSPNACEQGSTQPVTVSYEFSRIPNILKVDGVTLTAAKSGTRVISGVAATKSIAVEGTDQGLSTGSPHTASKTVTVNFYYPIYYGVGAESTTISNDFIKGLTRNIRGNLGFSFTANPGSNQKIYFCCPAELSPTFSAGGFVGGFETVNSSFNFTNASGATHSYKIFRTQNSGLGSTTITVN